MNSKPNHYDLACLEGLLEDALPEPLAGLVAEHVAECADCRARLEALAGQPQWWPQACSGVKAILADPAAYSSNLGEIEGSPCGANVGAVSFDSASDESFATDFAVDFLEPTDNSDLLGRLGEYEILEVIGRGGMGVVLKGHQRELNRYVAVKVLAPHLALSGAARKRFAREAQATAAVVNPHVMAIHAVAANARLPYLVMPFVACESLQERLNRQAPLDVKDVLRIVLQAARGLAAAHAQGLVHRDVKPANILLETSVDRVMLTDFGLARAVDDASLTRTGVIAGTPQYMSPEQACGDAVDHRSDLFSLGSVLYAMCTGRPPFRAETTFGVLRRIRETPPRPIREINADIPEWLERIVGNLLSKNAADRMASAAEVAALLEQCLAHIQQPTSAPLPKFPWDFFPVDPAMNNSEPKALTQAGPLNRWPMLGIACGAIILVATTLGLFFYHTGPASTVDSSAEPPQGPTSLDPLLQWNATQTELDASESIIDSLEASTRRDLQPHELER